MKLANKFLNLLEEFDYDKYSRSIEYIKDEIEASEETIKDLTDKLRDAEGEDKNKLKARIERHKERLNQSKRMLRKAEQKKRQK